MADSCVQCKRDVVLGDVIASVKCVQCSALCHVKCAGLNPEKKGLRKLEYRCVQCKGPSSNASSDSEEAGGKMNAVLKAIADLKGEFNTKLDVKLENLQENMYTNLDLKFSNINDTIANFGQTFEAALERISTENRALNSKYEALKVRCTDMADEIQDLRMEIHELQQYSRVDNLEVVGVPLSRGENVYTLLECLAKAINTPWRREDISVAHRVGGNRRQKHPNIIVRFVSRSTRLAWITAAKAKRNLSTIHLSTSFQPSPVYINEHLTATMKAVLSRAKKMVKEEKLAFAWVKEGKILIKTSAEARARRVWTVEDVESAGVRATQNLDRDSRMDVQTGEPTDQGK